MEGLANSKLEKQSIYEIYRACRLCGAGAGYKMPIIQNVVDLDSGEVELKQKIRECVQIEVHQDDKMPPLICELCVDKVNDFFEFLEMCRQTNKQTRLRLGLPPQTLPRGAPDAGDCILGVTEPIFVDNDDSNEPIARSKGKTTKSVKVKEPESRESRTKIKEETEHKSRRDKAIPKKDIQDKKEGGKDRHESRPLRRRAPSPPSSSSSSPSPPRSLRGSKRTHEDDVSLSRLQRPRRSDDSLSARPKSILKRERESESEERTSAKITRLREKENEKIANEKANTKKVVKIMVKKETFKSLRSSSPKPRKRTPSPPSYKCKVCKSTFDSRYGLNNHMRRHPKPYGDDDRDVKASSPMPRQRSPSPIVCKVCGNTFETMKGLSSHMRARHPNQKSVEQSPPPSSKKESKKVECRHCSKQFLSKDLLTMHSCSTRSVKSNKQASEDKPEKLEKPVSKPQRVSTLKKKNPVPIDPELLKQLRPLQVRISKCDPLLENKLGDHYDASDVDYDYGLDKTCVYPYIYTFRHMRIKSEPLYMVNIQDEIKSALDRDENYVHWDSDETNSDLELSDAKSVDTLTSISLKTLFSKKVLGKVPKKRRKAKVEKAFDSILNASNDFDSDMRLGIDNIINSLGDDKDKSNLEGESTAKLDKNDDNDSLFGDDNSPAIAITNDDFDSLFSSDKANDKNKTDNKSEDSITTNFSMDFTDDTDSKAVKTNDTSTVQDSNTLENKEFNKSDDSFKEDDISDAKNAQDDIDSAKTTSNELDKSASKEDLDISTNKAYTDENNSDNDKGDDLSTDDKENNGKNSLTNDDKDITEKNSSEPKDSILETDKDKAETDNDETHVNGQTDLAEEFNMDDLEDVSDSEMEETSVKAALSAQTDEKGTANAKTDVSERDKTVTEDSVVAPVKSADLESISDGEFD